MRSLNFQSVTFLETLAVQCKIEINMDNAAFSGNGGAELSRILTDPRGIEILMRLPSAKRNADLQATLIEALVGIQSATQP